jgi:ADP-heptose:LPS heptosyltransferase
LKRIGVLNFTRMGDLIQCGPLLDGLRQQESESELTLIVLENFAETAQRLPMVDEVITFPLDRFIPHLDAQRISLTDLYAGLSDFVALLKDRRFDRFYNLAHSRLSAAMTWLLHAPDTHGLTYDETGHLLITHPWINYYYYVTLNRTWNPFNLVEMYLPISPVAPQQPSLTFRVLSGDEEKAESLLSSRRRENDPLIAFQMGAAEERRRWPVTAFAELAKQLISSCNAQIVLLGNAEEKELSRAFVQIVDADRTLDLIGKTTVGTLAAVLKQCQVLVSNDTGTIHLAAATKTPTVGVFLGPAAVKDTGPYGDGHLLLEAHLPCAPCSYHATCSHCVCHEAIRPSDVMAAVACQLKKRSLGSRSWDWSRLHIHRTQVSPDGQLRLLPLMRVPLERETLMYSLYRVFWPLLLRDRKVASIPAGPLWTSEMTFLNEFYELCDSSALLTYEDEEAIASYENLASRVEPIVKTLSRELRTSQPSVSRLREMTLDLAHCDTALAEMEEKFPTWAPLAQFVRVLRGNVPDESPAGLAAACEDVYGTLIRGSKLLKSLWNEVTAKRAEAREVLHA